MVGDGLNDAMAAEEFPTEQLATRASKTAVTETVSPMIRYVTELSFHDGWIMPSTRAPPGRNSSVTLRYYLQYTIDKRR